MGDLMQGSASNADGLPPAVRIGLVQINNGFSGQNYLPYSVACLQSYVRGHAKTPARYAFNLPVYRRMPIHDIVRSLGGVHVAGFSIYVWNAQITLECARRLKAMQPETMIVMGGPQVPDQPEAFLRAHPFVDVVVHNEGERAFLKILEAFPGRAWTDIDGISFIDADGLFVRRANGERIRDLNELPSPFLNGMFDELIAANPGEQWFALWETNRGCPFRCTFCDWGSATAAKVNKFELDRLRAEARWFSERKITRVFCCDANFGILTRDVEIAQYVANLKRTSGYPVSLAVQSTKNAADRAYATQKILAEAKLNLGVSLSMQSLDDHTLKSIKRQNISLDTYLDLQRRFTRDGTQTYSDIILGLPGETYESFVTGVDKLISTGQHNRIQFNNLTILPNAEMADPAYIEQHGLVAVRSAIINYHGTPDIFEDDVPEYQQLVVATASMPPLDWRRVRAFAWMCTFLYFNKVLQIPIMAVHSVSGISYRDIFEAFMNANAADHPLLGRIRDFFMSEALSMQNGGPEYIFSQEWGATYWPADEHIIMTLISENKVPAFFDETSDLLLGLVLRLKQEAPLKAIEDAIKVNRTLVCAALKSGPDASPENDTISAGHDIMEFWRSVREGRDEPLAEKPTSIAVGAALRDFGRPGDRVRVQ